MTRVAERLLQVVDATDPDTPTLGPSYDTSGAATDVAVVGRYAFVVDGTGGLVILQVCEE